MTFTNNRNLPFDVLAIAPLDRQRCLVARAIAERAAPARPVFTARMWKLRETLSYQQDANSKADRRRC